MACKLKNTSALESYLSARLKPKAEQHAVLGYRPKRARPEDDTGDALSDDGPPEPAPQQVPALMPPDEGAQGAAAPDAGIDALTEQLADLSLAKVREQVQKKTEVAVRRRARAETSRR